MSKTVLQIPISKSLKTRAESVAVDYGFSSLQEIIRVFMAKLAKRAVEISFQEVIRLSPKVEARLKKMDEDFSAGRNVYFAETAAELKTQISE